jgi:hypothetical protein
MDEVFKVTLDVPRVIRWSFGAEARLGSLPRPPQLSDFGNNRKAFFALCGFIWAALDPESNPYERPDQLAEFLSEPEKVREASSAFFKAWKAAQAEKGNVPKN